MNMDAVTGPMESLRVQVLRLGALVAAQSRHAGEVALRGSASALTRTAQRLDTLADRIADAPAMETRDETAADARVDVVIGEEVKPEEVKTEDVKAQEVIADVAEASPSATPTDASPSAAPTEVTAHAPTAAHGASTPEASPYGSKKKHRQQRRPR
jgi:hypothetical protein